MSSSSDALPLAYSGDLKPENGTLVGTLNHLLLRLEVTYTKTSIEVTLSRRMSAIYLFADSFVLPGGAS